MEWNTYLAEEREKDQKKLEKEIEKSKKEAKQARSEGLAQGREDGIKQRNIEIAISLLQRGMLMKDIVEITNLSEMEIERLKTIDNKVKM